tara:strand:+ start:277 stop:519 length:243 start_codon:yes stop_codon:yes gene_type:complete
MAWNFVAQLAIAVVLSVASYLLSPKPQRANPAAREEIDVPTAQEGRPIYILFGTRDVEASVAAWHGDIKSVPIKRKGGKK